MMSTSIAAQALAISAALPESTGPDERLAGMSLYIRKVHAALPQRPGGITRPEIIAATGLPNGSVKQAIWERSGPGLWPERRRWRGIFLSIGGCDANH